MTTALKLHSPCLFGEILPKSVSAVFVHPLTEHDETRIRRLIAEATAHDYACSKIDNGERVRVFLKRNLPAAKNPLRATARVLPHETSR